MRTRAWIILLVALSSTIACAQSPERQSTTLWQWFTQWREHALTSDMDSGYIAIPEHPWLTSVNFDIGGYLHELVVPNMIDNGNVGTARFLSTVYNKVSLGAYYRGWGISYGHSLTNNQATQFTFTSYGQIIGFDLNYQNSNNMRCDIYVRDVDKQRVLEQIIDASQDNGTFSLLDINAYYVFNNRQFSYGAALGQSSMQMQDAGSFFIGLTYYQTTIDLSGSRMAQYLLSRHLDITSRQIAIGIGHGYNHVSSDKRFLLHGSIMPMLLIPVYNNFHMMPLLDNTIEWDAITRTYYKQRYDDLQHYTDHLQLSILTVFRGAVYWNISPRWVMGLTSIVTAYPPTTRHHFSTATLHGAAFAYAGFRF